MELRGSCRERTTRHKASIVETRHNLLKGKALRHDSTRADSTTCGRNSRERVPEGGSLGRGLETTQTRQESKSRAIGRASEATQTKQREQVESPPVEASETTQTRQESSREPPVETASFTRGYLAAKVLKNWMLFVTTQGFCVPLGCASKASTNLLISLSFLLSSVMLSISSRAFSWFVIRSSWLLAF